MKFTTLSKARMRLYWTLILATSLSACAVNPVTGERQLSFVSAEQEVDIGSRQFSPMQQSQGAAYVVDPELAVYVRSVGMKIAKRSDRPALPYDFVVLNNDVPNAWALPGGKIAINRGLLIHLEDEAQLAAVLAHEVVHAAARHSASQMSQSMVLGIGGEILGGVARTSEYGALANLGVQLGSGLYLADYSRDHELEADAFGIDYMARAGYDPMAAVELQQTFVKLSESRQSNWLEGLFASHPPSQQRVEANRLHAAKYPQNNLRNKAAFDRAMRQVRRDQAAYDANQKALKHLAKDDLDLALREVDIALAKQPQEALFYVTRARIYDKQNRHSDAIRDYDKAAKLHPENFLPWLGKGVAEVRSERFAAAENSLNKSLKLLPSQPGMFFMGEASLAQGKRDQAIRLYQEASKAGGELGQAAQQRLQSLGIQK